MDTDSIGTLHVPAGRSRSLPGLVAAAFFFAGVAVAWSWPLPLQLGRDIAGRGLGDNVTFLWNFWWMRMARASGVSVFHSDYLFAPLGTDLTLNTHTALPAFVGATLLARLPVLASLNVVVLAGLALNGVCAYLLIGRLVTDRAASIAGALVFAGSPYIAAHLNGHFNLTMPWAIPLFAICVLEALRGSKRWAVCAGLVLGLTAYVEYYYVVYEFALGLALLAVSVWRWTLVTNRGRRRGLLLAIAGGLAVDLAAIALIVYTGGFRLHLGPVLLVMEGLFNPLQILWLLLVAAAVIHFQPRVQVRSHGALSWRRAAVLGAIAGGVFLVVAAPIEWHAVELIRAGGYVTQGGGWRSAPAGIDVATFFVGSPYHAGWGPAVRHFYRRFGIDPIESGGWLGLVPLMLAAYALRRRRSDPQVRIWLAVGVVFFVWSLGAQVHVLGWNTGMLMPQVILRYTPILSNARMPGRTIVVVYLALAVLAAIALADLRSRVRRPTLLLVLAVAGIVVDFCPAPFATTAVVCPAIYETLGREKNPGAVAVLPLGVRDGFGEVAPFDHRILACQPVFHRPIVGGVESRLSPMLLAVYRGDPLIAAWLRMSGAPPNVIAEGPAPDASLAAERLAADRIAYVVLNRSAATPQLTQYVEQVLPLALVAEEGGYRLYRVR